MKPTNSMTGYVRDTLAKTSAAVFKTSEARLDHSWKWEMVPSFRSPVRGPDACTR